jgi:hypothetical protein
MWDDEAAFALATRLVQLARDAGVLTLLPLALNSLANLWVRAGDFAGAAALVEEADTITAATGNARVVFAPLVLAAWRGQEQQTSELVEACIRDAITRCEGTVITVAEYATAVCAGSAGSSRRASSCAPPTSC